MKLSQISRKGKPCVNIQSLPKFRSSACAMTKMAVKRTGVIKKHFSTFAYLFNVFRPETEEVFID
jgi:hypothetical protein